MEEIFPRDLKRKFVYSKYFHIEIFIYFPIVESNRCALGRKKILSTSIFFVDFFVFWRKKKFWYVFLFLRSKKKKPSSLERLPFSTEELFSNITSVVQVKPRSSSFIFLCAEKLFLPPTSRPLHILPPILPCSCMDSHSLWHRSLLPEKSLSTSTPFMNQHVSFQSQDAYPVGPADHHSPHDPPNSIH